MAFVAMMALSCSRTPFSLISEIHSVSTVTHYDKSGTVLDSYENLSIYVETEDVGSEERLQMQVVSPDGLDTWNFEAQKKEIDNIVYFGYPSLAKEMGTHIQDGLWHLWMIREDGRALEKEFTVNRGKDIVAPSRRTVVYDKKTGIVHISDNLSYAINLLSEEKNSLFEGEIVGPEIDLKVLTKKWAKVSSMILGYYDDTVNRSIVDWYEL